jgi:hypothetical protein
MTAKESPIATSLEFIRQTILSNLLLLLLKFCHTSLITINIIVAQIFSQGVKFHWDIDWWAERRDSLTRISF